MAHSRFTHTPLSVPIEVCERVIDAIGDWPTFSPIANDETVLSRETTLRSCTLVCHAWRIRSRIQLFKAVNLTGHQSLQRFLSFLSVTPWLGLYVKILQIHSPSSVKTPTKYDPCRDTFQLRDVFVLSSTAFHGRLPLLTSIRVSYGGVSTDKSPHPVLLYLPLHPTHQWRSRSLFGKVEELYLIEPTFANFSEAVRVLGAFSELRILRITRLRVTAYHGEIALPRIRRNLNIRGEAFLPKLQSLRVRISPHSVVSRI